MSNKVTYADIIESLAGQTGFSKNKSEAFTKALIAQVREELIENGKASITNFGSFKVKKVAERQGQNPQTGEPITIPEHNRVSFTPYKALKEEVNEEFAHLETELIEEEETSATTETGKDEPETDPFDQLDSESEADEEPEDFEGSSRFSFDQDEDESEEENAPFDFDEEEEEPETTTTFSSEIEYDDDASYEDETESDPDPSPFDSLEDDDDDDFVDEEETEEEVGVASGMNTTYRSRTHSRPKSNTGMILVTVLTLAVIIIASGWFFMSPDDSSSSMAGDEMEQAEPSASEAMMADSEAEDRNTDTQNAEEEAVEQKQESVPAAASKEAMPRAETEDTGEQGGAVQAPEKTYQVKSNEWYWVISEKVYGESGYWPLLFQKNETVNDNPDRLYPSSGLVVPEIEGSPGNLTKADYNKLASAFEMVSQAYTNFGNEERAQEYLRNARRWARLASEKE